MHILLNGKLTDNINAISIYNRAVQYGDSLFETINFRNGNPLFLNDHYERLITGMELIGMRVPETFSEDYFKIQLQLLCKANNLHKSARIRLQVYRNNGGHYLPENNNCSFIITAFEHNSDNYNLNTTPLRCEYYRENYKPASPLSNLKTGSALFYTLCALHSQKINADDCFVFNDKGKVIEAVSSNLFIIRNSKLITPPLTDGCIAGIMRKQILRLSVSSNISCVEQSLDEYDIKNCDEILLTNVIKGIVRVKCNESALTLCNQLLMQINAV